MGNVLRGRASAAVAVAGLLGALWTWAAPPASGAVRRISVTGVSTTEGDAPGVSAKFTLKLSAPKRKAVKVRYSTISGTATAGADFKATSGTATFRRGAPRCRFRCPFEAT